MSAPVALEGTGWRIVFERQGDRLGHRIEVDTHDGFVTVAASREGTSLDSWPPSPPLQDLHLERTPAGEPVALLVGGAGGSHWSASVTLDAGAAATFDIACRVKARPSWLGSCYRVLVKATDLGAWSINGRPLILEPLDADLRLEGAGDGLRLLVTMEDDMWPRTLRWRYRFAWNVSPYSR